MRVAEGGSSFLVCVLRIPLTQSRVPQIPHSNIITNFNKTHSAAVRAPRPAKGEAAAGGGNSSSLGMLPPSAAGSGTPAVLRLLRVSCAYLISVCETERSTYDWLFGSGDGGGGVGGRAKLSAAAALVHIAAAETRGISLPLSPMPSVQLDPTRLNTYVV